MAKKDVPVPFISTEEKLRNKFSDKKKKVDTTKNFHYIYICIKFDAKKNYDIKEDISSNMGSFLGKKMKKKAIKAPT